MTEIFKMSLSHTFKKRTLLAFELCMVLLLITGLIAWNTARESSTSMSSIKQVHSLNHAYDALKNNLDKIERRQLAYFISKDVNVITQRDDFILSLAEQRQALHNLTDQDVTQHANVKKIETILDQRINVLIESERIFTKQGFAAAEPSFTKGSELGINFRQAIVDVERQLQENIQQQQSDELARISRIAIIIIILLVLIGLISAWIQRCIHQRLVEEFNLQELQQPLLNKGALQDAIFNSRNFSCIATDVHGIIQFFNVGAERMLGYQASEVVDKLSPAAISDPQEVIERARVLSAEMNVLITPGFEALVYKASRGIEDIYELTYIRKEGNRFPANVSVTALRDIDQKIIGYLLIGIDNSVRKQIEATQAITDQRLRDLQFYTRSLIESNIPRLVGVHS